MSDRLHSSENAAAFTKETGGCVNSWGYFREASVAVAHRATGGLVFGWSSGFVWNDI